MRSSGIAVALAWPQTMCKQAGGWYDGIMRLLGINNNYYYTAGHAAIIIIEPSGHSHYFDFGRYHSPFGHGRVRGANTDPELKLSSLAKWQNNVVINLKEILTEISLKEACHGQGELQYSIFPIKSKNALFQIEKLQRESPILYGPFIFNGTNCSRFVNSIISRNATKGRHRMILKLHYTLTPSPMSIVNYGSERGKIDQVFVPSRPRHVNIAGVLQSQGTALSNFNEKYWLAGEGAGSWFVINVINSTTIFSQRYDPQGQLEFEGYFVSMEKEICSESPLSVSYLSHHQEIRIDQKDEIIIFYKSNDFLSGIEIGNN